MNRHNLLGRTSSEIDSMDINNQFEIDGDNFCESDYISSDSNFSPEEHDQEISQQSLNFQLLKQNLKNYGTMRGLHSFVDITTLLRLPKSSYVEYYDKQSYKSNPDLNRIYKGVPLNETDSSFIEVETKTEFHDRLFDLEDQRHHVDVEILQLKHLLKKIKQFKLKSYSAYQHLAHEQQLDFEEPIQKQLSQLKLQKELLNSSQDQETTLFGLSIDQKFYNNLTNYIQEFSPYSIKKFYSNKQNSIVTNLSLAFQIQDTSLQPQWLNQQEQNYIGLHQIHNLLLPPIQILNFQNQQALHFTCTLLSSAFGKLQQNQHNIWMNNLFQDFLNATFQFDDKAFASITENIKGFKNQLWPYEYFKTDDIQLNSIQQPSNYHVQHQFIIPNNRDKNSLQFFPNFSQQEILYSQITFLELFHLFHELYQRFYRIVNSGKMIFSESIISLIFQVINDEVKNFQFLQWLKEKFSEDIAIYFYATISVTYQYKRQFLNLDEHSKELLLIFTQKQLGERSKIRIQDAKLNLLITPENILRKMSYEQNSIKICRMQNVSNILFIHLFVLQDLQV